MKGNELKNEDKGNASQNVKYGEGMNEKKMKVILWMNCWQPNPITSLDSPSDSFLCVHCCMI